MRAAIRVEIKRKIVKINGENPAPLLAGPARGWCPTYTSLRWSLLEPLSRLSTRQCVQILRVS
jgi:hypothetical protein